jgi:hypothetical protein
VQKAKETAGKFEPLSAALHSFAVQIRDKVETDGDLVSATVTLTHYRGTPLTNSLDEIEGYIKECTAIVNDWLAPAVGLRETVNGVVYTICTIFLGLAFVFAAVYFFNCILARCVVTRFPCIGSFLAFGIILPGVLFSALFYPLYDICPIPEEIAAEAVGSGVVPSGAVYERSAR